MTTAEAIQALLGERLPVLEPERTAQLLERGTCPLSNGRVPTRAPLLGYLVEAHRSLGATGQSVTSTMPRGPYWVTLEHHGPTGLHLETYLLPAHVAARLEMQHGKHEAT